MTRTNSQSSINTCPQRLNAKPEKVLDDSGQRNFKKQRSCPVGPVFESRDYKNVRDQNNITQTTAEGIGSNMMLITVLVKVLDKWYRVISLTYFCQTAKAVQSMQRA